MNCYRIQTFFIYYVLSVGFFPLVLGVYFLEKGWGCGFWWGVTLSIFCGWFWGVFFVFDF